jgi:hypothetical protein
VKILRSINWVWNGKLLLLMIGVLAATASAAPEVLPAPQNWTTNSDESFLWHSRIPLVVADDMSDALRDAVDSFLKDTGRSAKSVRASRHKPGDPAVYIGVFDRHGSFGHRRVERMISSMKEPGPQGYRLAVSNRGIALAGSDVQGVRFGLETLKQLLLRGNRLNYTRIQDWPDVPLRGVYAEEPLSANDLKRLAALKCNTVLYASDTLLDLSGPSGQRWVDAFSEARRLGLDPIPVLDLLGGAPSLLRHDSGAAEGRIAEDRVILPQSVWVDLPNAHVLVGPDSPIRVTISGIPCEQGKDFEIRAGRTVYPFGATRSPWKIRRVPGGVIPDGATVDIRFAYAPKNTETLCPYAEATFPLWRDALKTIRDALEPKAIHLGLARPPRLGADLRCEVHTPSDAFAHAVHNAHEIAVSVNPDWRVLLWADAFLGMADDGLPRMDVAMGLVPPGAGLVLRGAGHARSRAKTEGLETELLLLVSGSAPEAYTMIESVSSDDRPGAGVIVPWSDSASLDVAMNKAWSMKSPQRPWPHGLNAHFQSNLWEPSYEDTLAAMAEYLNARFVAGFISPKEESDAFDEALRAVERELPRSAWDAKALRRQFGQLIEYAELEAAFSAKPRDTLLSRAIRLVEQVAEEHPGYDEQRTATIIETVRSRRILVPATILFGVQLLPYREYALPPETRLLPIPTSPSYRDSQGQAQATLDTLGAVAPIYRIDFDAVGTASVLIEERDGAGAFRSVQHIADGDGGARAPILIDAPFLTPSLRISLKAAGTRAVLRDARVFGLKRPPRAAASLAVSSVRIDGELNEETWKGRPDVYGFVTRDGARFAESPTTVHVRQTRDAILFGAVMHDRRIQTLDARYRDHDEPLWEGESFEVWIRTPLGAVYRFAINPNGATFDGKDGDRGWDGSWRGSAKVNEFDWSAEIELPLSLFDGSSPARGRWGLDFRRTRANVVREESTWAPVTGVSGEEGDLGRLVFSGP